MKIYFTSVNNDNVMVLDKIDLRKVMNSNVCFDNTVYDEDSGLLFSKTVNVMTRKDFFEKIIKNDLDLENGVGENVEPIEIKQGKIIDLIELSHQIICQKIFEKQYKNGEIKV